MSEPMDVEHSGTRYVRTRTPTHIKRFANITGCGRKTLKALALAFPTEDRLKAATEINIRNVHPIGPTLAAKIFAVKSGAAPEPDRDFWSGERRVVMWNKVSRKKISGAAAPKESDAVVWLARNKSTHEKYTGQDLDEKGPLLVPEASLMDMAEFQTLSVEMRVPLQEALARLPEATEPFGLKALAVPGEVEPPLVAGSLHFALLHAAANIDGDINSLHKALEGKDRSNWTMMIEACHLELKRPVWVWIWACSPSGNASASADAVVTARVFQWDGEHDPQQVTPIRIALYGGQFFALATLDYDSEVGVQLEPAVEEPRGHAQLPDLKEDVDGALADTQAQIDTIEKWSVTSLEQSYDLSRPKQIVDDLRMQLINGNGLDAAFLGMNGVGKSTIQNTLVLNSSIDEASYKNRPEDYVPEALLNIHYPANQERPSFRQLRDNPDATYYSLAITVLRPETSLYSPSTSAAPLTARTFDEYVKIEADEYAKTEATIKRYCEQAGDKPELKRFVLPAGDACASTTSLHTRLRFGSVVHLLVEHYTLDELKKQAFKFVSMIRELDGENPRDLDLVTLEALKEAWHVYLNVKQGPVTRTGLPRLSQMPKYDTPGLEARWQDIVVCTALLDIVSSPTRLYLTSGESLHLDRAMAHDFIKRVNDKEQVHRYAIKSIENYQPAGVLEGGNAFVDLPGQNDEDSFSTAQTREGVKEAGVVFVVLRKSLSEDKATLQLLRDSDTIKRAAAGEANVVFLFNREIGDGFKHRQLETQYEVDTRSGLEAATRELWQNELLEANDAAKAADDPHKSDGEIEQLAALTPMRTIYPMLHSSYKLNWQYAEEHKETQGDLSGSTRTFELSNINWLLGILETLNRSARVNQLKDVATKTLPELRSQLQGRMEEAKNASGGLPADLVSKAANILKSKRVLSSGLGTVTEELENATRSLGLGSDAARSFRAQIDNLVKQFFTNGEEIVEYLEKAARASDQRWPKMEKEMRRMHQAVQAVDTKHKGNFLGFSLLPMIFGNNSRQAPICFQRLVTDVEAVLQSMLERVVDLVVQHVEKLIDPAKTGTLMNSPAMIILRESFLQLDVLRPLQDRFSLAFFIKVRQRDPMLNEGKLDAFLKKTSAQMGVSAVHNKILSRSSDLKGLAEIKNHIRDNRDAVRTVWRKITTDRIQNFFGEQFASLLDDLTYHNKKTQAYSLKSMLTAFLNHIVNTDKIQRNAVLQRDLAGFIKDLTFKTNSLRSLWARLDGQVDPDTLGAEAARHVERRRQRELTLRMAKATFTLGTPNQTMPVTALQPEHLALETVFPKFISTKSLFVATEDDAFADMRAMLREKYSLDAFEGDGRRDLFSAVAVVAYTSLRINSTRDPRNPDKELDKDEHLTLAAEQLRAVTLSQMSHYYRKDERCLKDARMLGDSVQNYIARIQDPTRAYRGDMMCLFFLANHFQRAFRVWLPGIGSVIFPTEATSRSGARHSCAFQLMCHAQAPDEPRSEDYQPNWFPVRRVVHFSGVDSIRELPMTDDDCAARITTDQDALDAMRGRPSKRHRES